MTEHHSEFEAPAHTIVLIRFVGQYVVRTVLMHGEFQEFQIPREVYWENIRRNAMRKKEL